MAVIARKLTVADGVEFKVTIEPEDHSPEGQFDDPRDVAEIQARLERGEMEAWCMVTVTAEWRGFEGSDHLGACSLNEDYTPSHIAREHGMAEQALAALNEAIADTVGNLQPVLTVGSNV